MLLTIGDLLEEILIQLIQAPVRGTDTVVRSARVRGGSAANVAALDAEGGGSPRFVGQVGNDAIGVLLKDELKSRGVDVRVSHLGGTGVNVTTVGQGERSHLIDRGASRGPSRLEPECLDGVAQVYLAASAFTEDPLATAVDGLLAEIRDRRIPVVLGGPSAADLDSLGVAPYLHLVEAIGPDAVVLNQREHLGLGMQPRTGLPGAQATIVTAGSRPTFVMRPGVDSVSITVDSTKKLRDRTGVGDGFLAGFMASRRTGADALSACHAGHRVAGRVLGYLGPTSIGR